MATKAALICKYLLNFFAVFSVYFKNYISDILIAKYWVVRLSSKFSCSDF